MKIEIITQWDDNFFERFKNLKNDIYKDDSNVFNEEIDDLKNFFKPESPITRKYIWSAFIVSNNDKDLCRAVLSHKQNSKIGQIGFIESLKNKEAFLVLFEKINELAKNQGLQELRGPTNINFFVSYRWKLPSKQEPFYSEPLVPNYYHDFIKEAGFTVSETWDSFKLDYKLSLKRWKEKRKTISQKKKEPYQRLKLRSIRPWQFDKEIEIIHKLFVDSYKNMTEYDELDLESFKLLYGNFKYIINPLFSYIAYYKNEPIGFCFNFFDPLPLLKKFAKRPPTLLEKIKLLTQLQLNRKRLLIMYSGRIPTSAGEEVKGLQLKVSIRLNALLILMRIKDVFVCFQSENSPSKRTFDDDAQKSYSKYVMYRKAIS